MRRATCYDRINRVARSHRTVLRTVEVLIRLAESDPGFSHENRLERPALRALPDELDDVYFVWIFACFESDLRHYWRATVRDTSPPTEQLLSSIAARRTIPRATLAAVQRVREFRNHLIHEQHEVPQPITVADAIGHLNAYLAWLPLEW
jgi:hypothetical protein